MKRFARALVVMLAVVTLGSTIALLPQKNAVGAERAERRAEPVTVVNTPLPITGNVNANVTNASLPVSVLNTPLSTTVTNTPSVTITGTPAVAIAGTPTVQLTGDPAAGAAIQAQSTCPSPCSPTPFADVTLFTVPAGKRLVIEHISGFVQLPSGAQAIYSIKTAVDASYLGGVQFSEAHLDHLLGPVTQAGSVFSVSNSLRLYADAGTAVVFHVAVETAGGSVTYVLASLSGYLVDA
jgi:hypothetical protein